MTDFYNPYNFIPATGKIDGKDSARTPYADLDTDKNAHCRHDLWAEGTHSGRIVCRLGLETPTVVGAVQTGEDGGPKRVEPYRRNGQAAIPGSSLRGMVGSVLETLSQSALRVLDDREGKPYSYRVPVNRNAAGNARPLSAIGMLKTSKTNPKGFELVPLTLPTLVTQGNRFQLPKEWQKVFDGRDLSDCLSAYVNGYNDTEPKRYEDGSFLANAKLKSFKTQNLQFYYAKTEGRFNQLATADISIKTTGLYIKERTNKKTQKTTYFLIGRRLISPQFKQVITDDEYKALSTAQKDEYTKGFLRILGIAGRENDIPGTKKHELFIPKPPNTKRLPVPDAVIERFIRLGEEREQASKDKSPRLPFHLQGYDENDPDRWKPQDWLLVYFDVKLDDQSNPEISEISLSAIWRRETNASPQQFFAAIDKNLLPWTKRGEDDLLQRGQLTPAETLLGFVAEGKEEAEKNAPALASRLRFSDATSLFNPRQLREFTLKILSSPKPPSPAMYFHNVGPGPRYARKTELCQKSHRPNGRKIYLHHPKELAAAQGHGRGQLWETADPNEHPDQKLRCSPLAAGQDLFFHVDFDNLSDAELSLLLTALKPSEDFMHRLGLGRALGLGSVMTSIEGVFFIDRAKRYGLAALDSRKYHAAWRPNAPQAPCAWQGQYPEEATYAPDISPIEQTLFFDTTLIDSATRQLVETSGEPRFMDEKIAIHTPLRQTQLNNALAKEKETFKWFMANEESRNPQALPPIVAHKTLLPLHCEPEA